MLESIPLIGSLLRRLVGGRRGDTINVSFTINGDINDSQVTVNFPVVPTQGKLELDAMEIDPNDEDRSE